MRAVCKSYEIYGVKHSCQDDVLCFFVQEWIL